MTGLKLMHSNEEYRSANIPIRKSKFSGNVQVPLSIKFHPIPCQIHKQKQELEIFHDLIKNNIPNPILIVERPQEKSIGEENFFFKGFGRFSEKSCDDRFVKNSFLTSDFSVDFTNKKSDFGTETSNLFDHN